MSDENDKQGGADDDWAAAMAEQAESDVAVAEN